MPAKIEMGYAANYGMSEEYKKFIIKDGEFSVDARDFNSEKQIFETDQRTGKISREDLAELYAVFQKNAFDTIKNDIRQGITYDAPSEGIFINLNEQNSFQKGYGDNEPMSGNNLKRYQAVRKAILDLAAKYSGKNAENSPVENQSPAAENQQIFEFDAAELSHYVSGGTPAKLSNEDFAAIEDILQKAVAAENRQQTNDAQKIGSLPGYYRQVIPYMNSNGEKEVWINLFCSANGLNWRKVIVAVDGGGSCYLDLKINLVTKKAFNLTVNGAY